MTKFLLFAAPAYYPYGGMNDCKGVFDTLAETEAYMATIDEGYMDDCHVLQMPEMLVRDYDSTGKPCGVKPLDVFLQTENDDA